MFLKILVWPNRIILHARGVDDHELSNVVHSAQGDVEQIDRVEQYAEDAVGDEEDAHEQMGQLVDLM